jgi:hypothetical protein
LDWRALLSMARGGARVQSETTLWRRCKGWRYGLLATL